MRSLRRTYKKQVVTKVAAGVLGVVGFSCSSLAGASRMDLWVVLDGQLKPTVGEIVQIDSQKAIVQIMRGADGAGVSERKEINKPVAMVRAERWNGARTWMGSRRLDVDPAAEASMVAGVVRLVDGSVMVGSVGVLPPETVVIESARFGQVRVTLERVSNVIREVHVGDGLGGILTSWRKELEQPSARDVVWFDNGDVLRGFLVGAVAKGQSAELKFEVEKLGTGGGLGANEVQSNGEGKSEILIDPLAVRELALSNPFVLAKGGQGVWLSDGQSVPAQKISGGPSAVSLTVGGDVGSGLEGVSGVERRLTWQEVGGVVFDRGRFAAIADLPRTVERGERDLVRRSVSTGVEVFGAQDLELTEPGSVLFDFGNSESGLGDWKSVAGWLVLPEECWEFGDVIGVVESIDKGGKRKELVRQGLKSSLPMAGFVADVEKDAVGIVFRLELPKGGSPVQARLVLRRGVIGR